MSGDEAALEATAVLTRQMASGIEATFDGLKTANSKMSELSNIITSLEDRVSRIDKKLIVCEQLVADNAHR